MQNSIDIVKQGLFCYVYNDDAAIIHYLFQYKLVSGTLKVGFPYRNLERVLNTLENYKISYHVIENDTVIKKKNYNKTNQYHHYYTLALPKLNIEKRFALLESEIKALDEKEILRILKLLEDEVRK